MTSDTSHPIIDQLLTDAKQFSLVVDAGGDWDGASPCEGWIATDVLDHVISTERDFLGQRNVDLGPEPQGDPKRRWADHLSAVRGALTPGLMEQEYDGLLGRTKVGETLATYFGLDLVVHRWNLARALGRPTTFSDDELDRTEAKLDEIGDNIYLYGACKPALPVPDGASRQVAVLARLGRKAARNSSPAGTRFGG